MAWSHYYDRAGNPITMEEWDKGFELPHDEREKLLRVALTEIAEDIRVSTVWLGLDHNGLGGPPHIFETMVFGGPLDGEQWRYSTEAAAIRGHGQVVALVRYEMEYGTLDAETSARASERVADLAARSLGGFDGGPGAGGEPELLGEAEQGQGGVPLDLQRGVADQATVQPLDQDG